MDSSNKKTNLEELSKDELIKKCKNLITLAQKVKTSKEILQEENNNLQQKLIQKENNNAVDELLERLTNEKLSLVTEVEDLKLKNKKYEEIVRNIEEKHITAQEKLSSLETQNTSYARQVKRLTDENEQLISDLSVLEEQIAELHRLGVEQKQQLLELEKVSGNSLNELQSKLASSSEEVLKLNSSLKSKESEILSLSQELQALKIISKSPNENSNKKCDSLLKEVEDLKKQNVSLSNELTSFKSTNEKLKAKVSLYHSKLKKFALTAKELKEDKNYVIQLFKSYTHQINDWKDQLLTASEKLVQLKNQTNKEFVIKIEKLEKTHSLLIEEIMKKHESEIVDLKREIIIKEKSFHESEEARLLLANELKLFKDRFNEYVKSENGQLNPISQELPESKDELNTLNHLIKTNEQAFSKHLEEINAKHAAEIHSFEVEAANLKVALESKLNVIEENNLLVSESKIKELQAEINDLHNKLMSSEEELRLATETNLSAEIANKQLNESLHDYEEHLITVNEEISLKTQEAEASKQKINQFKEENSCLNTSLIASKEEIIKLNNALQRSLDTEKRLAEKSSEEILRLAQSNKELEEKCEQLLVELNDIKSNILLKNELQTSVENVSPEHSEDTGVNLKRENSELLLEMNQMNQALKERGERISKLEAHCEEMKKRLQLYEAQANKNIDSISEKEETIITLKKELEQKNQNSSDNVSKDIEISKLRSEIEALKDRCNFNIDSCYADSENLSTSTISRTEEVNRIKDLEGPWEERYGKLRILAVKLKAKVRDQNNFITGLEKEREELLHKHSSSLKTVQSLQTKIDILQDELDKVTAENKQYFNKLNSVAETISRDKQLLVQNDDNISKLNKQIEDLKADKKNVESWKKEVSAKVQTLRKELEAKNVLIKEAESKVSKLEAELKGEQENLKQTKTQLEQIGSEFKKNSVLNLEMQDYERSAKELSQKVEKQRAEISNLYIQLDMQKNTANALREQNKILEERVREEKNNGTSTSQEINACKKVISNLEELLQQKEDKILDLTKLLETTRSENEELSTEMTKVISEHQKSVAVLRADRDHLRQQMASIQQTLRETQDSLKLREDEFAFIKEDYDTYKVRAQSVLKKNQTRDLGLEEKLSEELASLRTQNANLVDQINEISEKNAKEKQVNLTLSKEKVTSVKRSIQLECEVEELKRYSEQLEAQHQKAVAEHAEAVRNLKVHAETLSQCYRQQISEQELRHNREIIELQSRMEKAPSPIEALTIHPNMPREEGEGSESIESNTVRNNVHPIPLERLLDSKSEDETTRLKKQVIEQDSKIIHLTALLSDTEQDLAKHVQMNKVLKEEIRRQQRSVEREKHAENLEYLKNVVFKFVTLNSGDERTRLVPVLNTILKLSPEETQKLSMVAKGDPGLKAWANYLPIWSSPNKPQ